MQKWEFGKTALATERCCKNQDVERHAGRGATKILIPIQRGAQNLDFCNTPSAIQPFLKTGTGAREVLKNPEYQRHAGREAKKN